MGGNVYVLYIWEKRSLLLVLIYEMLMNTTTEPYIWHIS